MKTVVLLLALLFVGCTTAPKNVYVHPEKFNADLIIPLVWDGHFPVAHFEHEMVLNTEYYDYQGHMYRLVETDIPGVYAIRIDVPAP
jgi:hypothetical protein